jgi:hypothetical protein
MPEEANTRRAPDALTWIVLNCEGDIAFGPFLWARLEPGELAAPMTIRVNDGVDEGQGKVFAEFAGDAWTVRDTDYPRYAGLGWREPRFTTLPQWLGARKAIRTPRRRKIRRDHPRIEKI